MPERIVPTGDCVKDYVMASKPKERDISKDHPLAKAGWVHELEVMEFFGLSWSTWERNYRTKIPGKTFPHGRFFHINQLVPWWDLLIKASDEEDQSEDGQNDT